RQHQLRIQEKLRNFVVPLVPDHLRYRFDQWVFDVRPLALDNHQWDTVHEQDDVRPPRLVTTGTFDYKLRCAMEDVVCKTVCGEIYIAQRETLLVAVNHLGQALA